MHLVDLCLSTKQLSTKAVVVSCVASLVLEVKDKVEVGSIITAVTIGSQRSFSGGGQAQFPVTGAGLGQVTATSQVSYGGEVFIFNSVLIPPLIDLCTTKQIQNYLQINWFIFTCHFMIVLHSKNKFLDLDVYWFSEIL